MFIIASNGKTIGNYAEVSRIGNRILGWATTGDNPRFSVLAEFETDPLAQASFEDFIQEFGKHPDKINFIYQIVGVDNHHSISYN